MRSWEAYVQEMWPRLCSLALGESCAPVLCGRSRISCVFFLPTVLATVHMKNIKKQTYEDLKSIQVKAFQTATLLLAFPGLLGLRIEGNLNSNWFS